jgi:hypothetical protein
VLKDELRDDDSKSDLIDERERRKKKAYIVFCFVILGMRQSNYR